MEIRTIVKDTVDIVKKNGGRLLLGAALAASAVTLVRPVQVRADGGPVCRTNLILENPSQIVAGNYLVNGKAEFRAETTIVSTGGNAPKDVLWEPDSATLSTEGVTTLMKPEDIDPDAIEMEKVGFLDNGKVVFKGRVSPEAAKNMTRVNVKLTTGDTCSPENESDATTVWRSNLKKIIELYFPAINYDKTVTK